MRIMENNKKNSKTEWKTISFPEEYIAEIARIIENPYVKANYAIRSVPDFLRRGGSELLQKIKKEIEDETGIRP